jgi:hypothetical protein
VGFTKYANQGAKEADMERLHNKEKELNDEDACRCQ